MTLSSAHDLSHLDTATIKRLYNAHRNIRALCWLWGIGAVLLLLGLFFALFRDSPAAPGDRLILILLFLLAALQVLAIVGLARRPAWGRTLGIIVSCLSLINFPIGTVIAAFCIYVLVKSPELFGPDRMHPDELTAEYKKRKA